MVVECTDVVAQVPVAVYQGPETVCAAGAAPLVVLPGAQVGDTAQPADLEADPVLEVPKVVAPKQAQDLTLVLEQPRPHEPFDQLHPAMEEAQRVP